MSDEQPEKCKHRHSYFREIDLIGMAWCPDCNRNIGMDDCLNARLAALDEAIEALKTK